MTHPKDPLEPIQFPVAPGSSETVKAPPSQAPGAGVNDKNSSKNPLPKAKSPNKRTSSAS